MVTEIYNKAYVDACTCDSVLNADLVEFFLFCYSFFKIFCFGFLFFVFFFCITLLGFFFPSYCFLEELYTKHTDRHGELGLKGM